MKEIWTETKTCVSTLHHAKNFSYFSINFTKLQRAHTYSNMFPKHGIWNIYHSAVELQMAVRLPACVFEPNSGSVQEQQLLLGMSHCSILTYEVFNCFAFFNYFEL